MEQSAAWGMPFDHREILDHAPYLADQHDTQDTPDDLSIFLSPPSFAMAMSPPAQHPNTAIYFPLHLIQSIK